MNQPAVETRSLPPRRAWWIFVASGFAALIVYGVLQLTEKPRIETITTSAPAFNSNAGAIRDAGYRPAKHRK